MKQNFEPRPVEQRRAMATGCGLWASILPTSSGAMKSDSSIGTTLTNIPRDNAGRASDATNRLETKVHD